MTLPLPCHLPAGHRVKYRGIGAVGMVWETSRDRSCRKPPETQHQAQLMYPDPLGCGRIIIKPPQFFPGVTGSWPGLFPPGHYSQQSVRTMAVPAPALLGLTSQGWTNLTEGSSVVSLLQAGLWHLGAGQHPSEGLLGAMEGPEQLSWLQ